MKRRFFYRQNGEIVAYTNGGYIGCSYPSILIDTTPEQEVALVKNYDIRIEKAQLVISVPEEKLMAENKENFIKKVKEGQLTLKEVIDYLITQ